MVDDYYIQPHGIPKELKIDVCDHGVLMTWNLVANSLVCCSCSYHPVAKVVSVEAIGVHQISLAKTLKDSWLEKSV